MRVKAKKSSTTSFRFSQEARELLEKLAKKERRSMSNMIEILIFNYADKEK